VAHEGDSKQHTRLSRPAAEATAGEAMDLGSLSTATEAMAPSGATTHGPELETLLEGVEYDAETKDAAEAPEAAAAAVARVRPPRPADWGTITRGQRKYWKQHGGRSRCNPGHGGTWVPREDPTS